MDAAPGRLGRLGPAPQVLLDLPGRLTSLREVGVKVVEELEPLLGRPLGGRARNRLHVELQAEPQQVPTQVGPEARAGDVEVAEEGSGRLAALLFSLVATRKLWPINPRWWRRCLPLIL